MMQNITLCLSMTPSTAMPVTVHLIRVGDLHDCVFRCMQVSCLLSSSM